MFRAAEPSSRRFAFRPLAIASAGASLIEAVPRSSMLLLGYSGNFRPQSSWHPRRAGLAIALPVALALVAGPTAAQLVSSSGDVSPSFAEAASVNLAGQRVFIGFTNDAAGTLGTLSVTGGGSLTAAQIVPGVGGLGIGTVNVNGLGSIINLTGGAAFNGLDIGSWGTGTMTVSNGGTVACSSPLACPYSSIGNGAGSTGVLTVNGGVLSRFGSFAVGTGTLSAGFGTSGAPTSATLNILNDGTRGGSLATTGYSSVASNSGQAGLVTGNVTIDGAGSNWTITRDLASGGGQAFLGIAPSTNTNANVIISNGGTLSVTGSRSNVATDSSLPGFNMSTAAGATSTMTVTSGGSVLIGGDTGAITLGGNSSTSSAGAKATLSITNGGKVSGTGPNGLTFMAIGRNLGEGIVNVDGAGSQLTVAGVGGQNVQGLDGLGGTIQVGGNRNNGGGGIGTLNVSNGGSVLISDNGQVASTGSMSLRLADGTGTSGTVNVSGPGSSILIASTGGSATTPYVSIGQGGVGKMTVEAGGTVFVQGIGQRNFIVGNSSTGSGTLDVKTGAQIGASWFAVGNEGGSGTATINNATVNLDGVVYFNGNPLGAGARVGRGVGSDSVLKLENGAALNINNSIADASVILGGTGALAGGKGTLNMSGGSTINFTGSAANASLQVGGSTGGIAIMSMSGNSIVNVGATGRATVGGVAGSTGSLALDTGSRLLANSIDFGGDSDSVVGGTGSGTVTGIGSALKAAGANAFIGVGRGGTGSLTVTNQGQVTGTILAIGRSGGTGTLTVDNGTIELSGQQTTGNLSGARFTVGIGGGSGVAALTSGSTVNVTNLGSDGAAVSIGGSGNFPLGTGTLSLAGGSQLNVKAATGTQANVNIGRDGTGSAALAGGSSISVGSDVNDVFAANGNLYVGRQTGSVGTLNMSGQSVVNAGFVGIGVGSAGFGNALGTPGGTATLTLNDSTINTSRFELGVNGLLTGNNGVINVADSVNPVNGLPVKGPVVIGGTISPGNSPGRLRINCDLTMLSGSKLILEINDSGVSVDIDQLIIGEDSNFNLFATQIIFSFLGSTNPEQVDLNLNRFLRAGTTGSNETTGLQRVFKVGDDWNDVVNSKNFAFQSSVYDVTSFEFNPLTGGIIGVEASAIPEPATYALVLLALGMMRVLSRRSAARRW